MCLTQARLSFPRARGDVPTMRVCAKRTPLFSPRTRGCSGTGNTVPTCVLVFPAHAGMFLAAWMKAKTDNRFPRARGDVPVSAPINSRHCSFSPRTRGCSVQGAYPKWFWDVFPACAGMFRRCMFCKRRSRGFPRARGDVPRGPHHIRAPQIVFPAHAGMFRVAGALRHHLNGFPRARGDVPDR